MTYLDPATGERTELSATSVANAAAKIANALRDEYDLEPGDAVALDIPVHWQLSTWCAGTWTAGCIITDDPTTARLIVTTPARASRWEGPAPAPVIVVSSHPFGLPVTDPLPAGVSDATLAVRQQPDAYLFDTPEGSMPALSADGTQFTQDQVIDAARSLGPASADRVLLTNDLTPPTSWLGCVAMPLALDGSVVLVNASEAPSSILDQERVSARLTS